jgi:putative oxidoreductase
MDVAEGIQEDLTAKFELRSSNAEPLWHNRLSMTAIGLLLLRLVLAAVCVAHGAHALFGAFGGPGSGVGPGGLGQTAAQYTAMGLPGFAVAVLAGLANLVGGLLLGVGYLTRWAAATLALLTGLLAWKSQLVWGFFLNWIGEPGRGHGMEFSIVLIGALLCLALTGGGDWSLDGGRSRRRSAAAAGRARLRRS